MRQKPRYPVIRPGADRKACIWSLSIIAALFACAAVTHKPTEDRYHRHSAEDQRQLRELLDKLDGEDAAESVIVKRAAPILRPGKPGELDWWGLEQCSKTPGCMKQLASMEVKPKGKRR